MINNVKEATAPDKQDLIKLIFYLVKKYGFKRNSAKNGIKVSQ
jgi:hypothetical protein